MLNILNTPCQFTRSKDPISSEPQHQIPIPSGTAKDRISRTSATHFQNQIHLPEPKATIFANITPNPLPRPNQRNRRKGRVQSPSTRPNPDEGDLGLRGGLDGDGGAHDGARPPARAREAGRRAEEGVVRGGAPQRHHLRQAREEGRRTARRRESEMCRGDGLCRGALVLIWLSCLLCSRRG